MSAVDGTESCLTRATTIIALTCFLIVGAAAAGILGYSGVAGAMLAMSSPGVQSPAMQGPVSNWEGKKDKLAVATPAPPSFEPPQAVAAVREPLRQAYASTAPD